MQENESSYSVRYIPMDVSIAIKLDGLDTEAQENLESMEYWDQVLVDTATNRIIYYDGGEPEDMYLNRALLPFIAELNRLANE